MEDASGEGEQERCLEKKDAMKRARWRVGVREIAAGVYLVTPVYGDKPGSKLDDDDDDIQCALAEYLLLNIYIMKNGSLKTSSVIKVHNSYSLMLLKFLGMVIIR